MDSNVAQWLCFVFEEEGGELTVACCAVFKEGKGKGKEGKERKKGKRKKVEQKKLQSAERGIKILSANCSLSGQVRRELEFVWIGSQYGLPIYTNSN